MGGQVVKYVERYTGAGAYGGTAAEAVKNAKK
jgi:hypothetical protein